MKGLFALLVVLALSAGADALRGSSNARAKKAVNNSSPKTITSLLSMYGCREPFTGMEGLDPDDVESVEHLIKMSQEEQVPNSVATVQKSLDELKVAHQGQQKLVDDSYKAFQKCDKDFGKTPGVNVLSTNQQKFDKLIQPHKTCRDEEVAATSSSDCKQDDMKQDCDSKKDGRKEIEERFINSCTLCTPSANDKKNFGNFFKKIESTGKSYFLQWTAANEEVTECETAYNKEVARCATLETKGKLKTAECDGKMRELENLACVIGDEQKVLCKTINTCYETAKTTYNAVVGQAQKEATAFKESWKAHTQMKCIAEKSSYNKAECKWITECVETSKATDVTHLDIIVKPIPMPSQCDPKYIQDPCTSEYKGRVYSGIDASLLPKCKTCKPVMCKCNTPLMGTAGYNKWHCDDKKEGYCAANEECYNTVGWNSKKKSSTFCRVRAPPRRRRAPPRRRRAPPRRRAPLRCSWSSRSSSGSFSQPHCHHRNFSPQCNGANNGKQYYTNQWDAGGGSAKQLSSCRGGWLYHGSKGYTKEYTCKCTGR